MRLAVARFLLRRHAGGMVERGIETGAFLAGGAFFVFAVDGIGVWAMMARMGGDVAPARAVALGCVELQG